MPKAYLKDPNASLDYVFDWSQWLAEGETIRSAVVTVPSDLTRVKVDTSATQVTAWLAGGIDGRDYTVSCAITTNQDRTDERSILVRVRER